MADRRLRLLINLAESLAKRRVEKERIVAEAVAAGAREGDLSLARFAHRPVLLAMRSGRAKRQGANKSRRAPFARDVFQRVEQLRIVALVIAARAGVARGINARRAVQGVHFQAGII